MPELPDVAIYVERLRALTAGHTLSGIRIASPFILRSVTPTPQQFESKTVETVERIGKRIVIGIEGDLFAVIHLMIAGRLHWHATGKAVPKKRGLAAFDFSSGTMILTEAGTKRRASLYLVEGRAGLQQHDRGGIQVLEANVKEFRAALTRENHTLKRSLTDPRIFSGIGNAYSDEILHAARLSPLQLSHNLNDVEIDRLFHATRETLTFWIDKTREETGDGLPTKVTAFREGMAVHGRYKQPCPVCQAPVQRIVYAKNEMNYCARCQTEGRLLADRAFSRLLKKDWPRTLDEWEAGRP